MTKSEQIIKLMDEAMGDPVRSIEQIQHGKSVMFKPGHRYAGLLARVIRAKDGKADVKIGQKLEVDVPIADLLLPVLHRQ